MSRKSAFLKINPGSGDEAAALYNVLRAEVQSSSASGAQLRTNKSSVELEISSHDPAVFRAIFASYSRFIRIYEDIKNIDA